VGLGLAVLGVGGVTAAIVEHKLSGISHVTVGEALGRFGAVLPFVCALAVVLVLGAVVLSFYLLNREARRKREDVGPKPSGAEAGRDRLLSLIEGMSQALLALDASQRVALANSAARELLGANVDPLGRTLPELMRGPPVNRLLEAISEGRAAEEVLEIEGDLRRTVLVRAAPIEPAGSVIVLDDVTQLRRPEPIVQGVLDSVADLAAKK
jgi:PAS domain-containing protein